MKREKVSIDIPLSAWLTMSTGYVFTPSRLRDRTHHMFFLRDELPGDPIFEATRLADKNYEGLDTQAAIRLYVTNQHPEIKEATRLFLEADPCTAKDLFQASTDEILADLISLDILHNVKPSHSIELFPWMRILFLSDSDRLYRIENGIVTHTIHSGPSLGPLSEKNSESSLSMPSVKHLAFDNKVRKCDLCKIMRRERLAIYKECEYV